MAMKREIALTNHDGVDDFVQEHYTALISSAVTDEIDVCGSTPMGAA